MLTFPSGVQSSMVQDPSRGGEARISFASLPLEFRQPITPLGGASPDWEDPPSASGSFTPFSNLSGDTQLSGPQFTNPAIGGAGVGGGTGTIEGREPHAFGLIVMGNGLGAQSSLGGPQGRTIVERGDMWGGPGMRTLDVTWTEAAALDVVSNNPRMIQVVEGDGITLTSDNDDAHHLAKVTLSGRPILWAKATASWVHVAGNGSYVNCHTCDDEAGTNEGNDPTFKVYLPCSESKDPNVQDDEVIGYIRDENETRLAATAYVDDKIGTVKMWSGAANAIPGGWLLCDGGGQAPNKRPDLRGRFVVGYHSAGGLAAGVEATVGDEDDYDAIGDTGGDPIHGPTANNHDNHDAHSHSVEPSMGAGGSGSDGVLIPPGDPPLWFTSSDNLTAHSDSNNRPPYYCIAFIVRVTP